MSSSPIAAPGKHKAADKAEKALASAEAKVIPKRYKTKMCRTFVETGSCPYYHKCMFAHGPEDMRTTVQNRHDGFVSETAIKDHQVRLQIEGEIAHIVQTASQVTSSAASTPVPADPYSPTLSSTYAGSPMAASRRTSMAHASSSVGFGSPIPMPVPHAVEYPFSPADSYMSAGSPIAASSRRTSVACPCADCARMYGSAHAPATMTASSVGTSGCTCPECVGMHDRMLPIHLPPSSALGHSACTCPNCIGATDKTSATHHASALPFAFPAAASMASQCTCPECAALYGHHGNCA